MLSGLFRSAIALMTPRCPSARCPKWSLVERQADCACGARNAIPIHRTTESGLFGAGDRTGMDATCERRLRLLLQGNEQGHAGSETYRLATDDDRVCPMLCGRMSVSFCHSEPSIDVSRSISAATGMEHLFISAGSIPIASIA